MGMTGAPNFVMSGPIGPPAGYTPPSAPPAPPPPPAPSDVNEAATLQVTKKGKVIPRGKHGNRLDTAAGRAKEAKMLQEEQIRIANAAMKVAVSEKAHGRESSAREASRQANIAANRAVTYNKQRASDEGLRPSKNLQDFAKKIKSFDPSVPKIEASPTPKDTGGGGGGGVVSQPTISRPSAPFSAPSPPRPKIVKNPNRDVVDLSRDQFSVSSIARLLYDDIGSIELVNIARRETIEGQNPYYSLISNLSSIRKNFDPTSIIARQKSNENIYSNYTISLNEKIPDDEYLDRNNLSDFYYIDDNGDLVIELDNLDSDEIIDFEIAESGTINLVDEA